MLSVLLDRIGNDIEDAVERYSENGYSPEVISELNDILERVEELNSKIEASKIEADMDGWEDDWEGISQSGIPKEFFDSNATDDPLMTWRDDVIDFGSDDEIDDEENDGEVAFL